MSLTDELIQAHDKRAKIKRDRFVAIFAKPIPPETLNGKVMWWSYHNIQCATILAWHNATKNYL